MTPQEKAKEIAEKNHKTYFEFENDGGSQDVSSYKECYNSAMQMHDWTKGQVIEKAYKFLMHKFPYLDIDTIKEFVDAMKGE